MIESSEEYFKEGLSFLKGNDLERATDIAEKIVKEYEEIMLLIADLKDILANEYRKYEIIKTELTEIKERY